MAYSTFTQALTQAKRNAKLRGVPFSTRDLQNLHAGYMQTAGQRVAADRSAALADKSLAAQQANWNATLAQNQSLTGQSLAQQLALAQQQWQQNRDLNAASLAHSAQLQQAQQQHAADLNTAQIGSATNIANQTNKTNLDINTANIATQKEINAKNLAAQQLIAQQQADAADKASQNQLTGNIATGAAGLGGAYLLSGSDIIGKGLAGAKGLITGAPAAAPAAPAAAAPIAGGGAGVTQPIAAQAATTAPAALTPAAAAFTPAELALGTDAGLAAGSIAGGGAAAGAGAGAAGAAGAGMTGLGSIAGEGAAALSGASAAGAGAAGAGSVGYMAGPYAAAFMLASRLPSWLSHTSIDPRSETDYGKAYESLAKQQQGAGQRVPTQEEYNAVMMPGAILPGGYRNDPEYYSKLFQERVTKGLMGPDAFYAQPADTTPMMAPGMQTVGNFNPATLAYEWGPQVDTRAADYFNQGQNTNQATDMQRLQQDVARQTATAQPTGANPDMARLLQQLNASKAQVAAGPGQSTEEFWTPQRIQQAINNPMVIW